MDFHGSSVRGHQDRHSPLLQKQGQLGKEDEHLTNYMVSSEIIIINQWICVTGLGFILSECRGVHHGWTLPEPTSQRVSAFPGWPFWIQVFHSGSNRYAASSFVQDLLLLFGYPVW